MVYREPSDAAGERPLASGRRLLYLGFGCLLVTMVVISWDVVRSLAATTARSASLMREFRERDQILDELREGMIQSGTLLREYLSETDAARAAREKVSLEALRTRAEQLLATYQQRLRPDQSEMFAAMRTSVRAYLQSLSIPLAWDAETRAKKGETYRRDAVGPLRAVALRVRRQIYAVNEHQLDAGERQIAEEHQHLRRRLLMASVVAVLLCAILAVVVVTRITRLEAESSAQYRKVVHARKELRTLAGRLEAAQEEERRSLSRELHDEVGQSMSALLIDLGKLDTMLPAGGPERAQLSAIRRLAESNVKAVRNMALLLRPSMLDDLGLVAALKWQGRETARRTGLRVSIDVDEATDSLPESYRTCIYRVVQESLNNVVKHARASAVRVLVRRGEHGVELSVQDNGAGFETSEKGVGLLGMEERVARLGGALRVESLEGEGTVLSAVMPVREREAVV